MPRTMHPVLPGRIPVGGPICRKEMSATLDGAARIPKNRPSRQLTPHTMPGLPGLDVYLLLVLAQLTVRNKLYLTFGQPG